MGIRSQYIYRMQKQVVTDDTKIWYGKHKGTRMKDIPDGYIYWLKWNGPYNIKHYINNK